VRSLYLLSILFLLSCGTKTEEETQISTSNDTATEGSSITRDTEPRDLPLPLPDTSQKFDTLSSEPGRKLMPVDEASQDTSFARFRRDLLRAVRDKNGDAVVKALDPNIKLSFGGQGGLPDFQRMWKPNDKKSPLWEKLEWVLAHGGSFRGTGNDRSSWAPYVYSNWPDSGPEPFEYGAITGRNVPVYARPDTTQVIAVLDYHFVKAPDGTHLRENKPRFIKIVTPTGKTGYVRSPQIRSQLDYRAGFQKSSGQWKMSVFIAGD
jgi:hypothetical protein